MKSMLRILTIIMTLALVSPLTRAQSPTSVFGNGYLIGITNGTYPLASYGYLVFLPANSGNSFQIRGIYGISDATGTYSYTQVSPTYGQAILNDPTDGTSDLVGLTFGSATEGSFKLSTISPSGYSESGDFIGASSSAPSSINGMSIYCVIADGIYPLASSGSFTISFAATGNTYIGTGTQGSSTGTYSYSQINRSTGVVQINDVSSGASTVYVGFSTPTTGGYACKAASGAFQIASFTVWDTTPPTVSITSPTAGQYLSNSVFNATGTARDNVQVSSVWYWLNGGGWNLASTANGWTNWSAVLSLQRGNNVFKVCAVDSSGNYSTTNSVDFTYVVCDTLRLRTVGLGAISPNYSNAVLQLGNSYNMEASPASGFAFGNWIVSTNWSEGNLSNNPTLYFIMESNLTIQATFNDTNKPTVSVTNLIAGQRISNAVVTVRGTANDNWQVSNVVYQLNVAGWNNAVTANNWTNWSADLTLTAGTNSLLVYATDTSGNRSTTNSLKFQFVVTNQLMLSITGLGTITPSNTWLEIGRNYSITALPAAGFKFGGWTGSLTTNTAVLNFMMESNLSFTANFVETNKPTLAITSPISGQRMSNALATVIGTASDKWQVSGVWYEVNTNAWKVASTTNNYMNWTSEMLTLVAGTNTIKAYALNLGGNYSLTNTLNIYSSNTFSMRMAFTNSQPLTTNGLAFILQLSPGLNGHIQVSTNLTSWTPLTTFIGTNSTLIFRDTGATNSAQRFYRAVVP